MHCIPYKDLFFFFLLLGIYFAAEEVLSKFNIGIVKVQNFFVLSRIEEFCVVSEHE